VDFTLIKKPLASLPIVMSVGALTLPWIWLLVFGPDPSGDEGGAAHIWQLFMVGQVFVIAFFAVVYLPQKPKQALIILAAQIAAFLAAAAPVFLLEL